MIAQLAAAIEEVVSLFWLFCVKSSQCGLVTEGIRRTATVLSHDGAAA